MNDKEKAIIINIVKRKLAIKTVIQAEIQKAKVKATKS